MAVLPKGKPFDTSLRGFERHLMPRTASLILICVAAFVLAPLSHYLAIGIAVEGLSRDLADSFSTGIMSLLFGLMGWIPGWLAAAALAFTGNTISYRDAVTIAAGPALLGALSSCAIGPTSPFP